MNKIVYENTATETLTTQQLLERVTFFDDHYDSYPRQERPDLTGTLAAREKY